ncbi:dihydrolipoyl dehydrogenase [Mesomycoplasma hyorhinis]|uniref:dihydrolipoyl dehydrogenase n=1 Tax=Mesomycoplasma hyorhinis TaxID=2100 RepID=UPI001C04EEA3|nr:dihydrolipoyl dehydrogenase [Mesomycoplasma hyorhinis]
MNKEIKKFDIAVLGAGPGGYSLALLLVKNNKKVVLFERQDLGGTCVNEGCIPTKTLIKSARVFEEVKKSSQFGVHTHKVHFNFFEIQARRKKNKEKLNNAILNGLTNAGVEVVFGEATILDKNNARVNEEDYTFDKLVLASGSSSRKINIEGQELVENEGRLLYSTDLLNINKAPKKLVIIGAGPISLEFAYLFSALGSEVSIVESREFLGNFDTKLQSNVKEYLQQRNIKIYENSKVVKFTDANTVLIENEEQMTLGFCRVLIAVGRVANTESFKNLNLELNPNQSVKVDHRNKTSLENVYAIGDVTGSMMLSSIAYKQGDIVAKDILEFENEETLDVSTTPWAIYLNQDVAGVGLSDKQLEREGVDFVSVEIPTSSLPRAHADNLEKQFSFLKMNVEKSTGRILGCFMFLEDASNLINTIALAVKNNLTIFDLQKSTYTHPTLSEAIYYLSRSFVF